MEAKGARHLALFRKRDRWGAGGCWVCCVSCGTGALPKEGRLPQRLLLLGWDCASFALSAMSSFYYSSNVTTSLKKELKKERKKHNQKILKVQVLLEGHLIHAYYVRPPEGT